MKIDILAQRLFGIAAIVFATLFGISTIVNNAAKADNPMVTNESGKIQMHQNSFVHNGGYYFHILVWDTETGKSKLYNFKGSSLVTTSYQLPSSPLY